MTDLERKLTNWVKANIKSDLSYNKINWPDDTVVKSVSFCTIQSGYCDTCAYEAQGLDISYSTGGIVSSMRVYFDFELGEFMRDLLSGKY